MLYASSGLPLAVDPFYGLPCVRWVGTLASVGESVVGIDVGSKGGKVNYPVAVRRATPVSVL
jgi:hypothetical protein